MAGTAACLDQAGPVAWQTEDASPWWPDRYAVKGPSVKRAVARCGTCSAAQPGLTAGPHSDWRTRRSSRVVRPLEIGALASTSLATAAHGAWERTRGLAKVTALPSAPSSGGGHLGPGNLAHQVADIGGYAVLTPGPGARPGDYRRSVARLGQCVDHVIHAPPVHQG